MIYITKVELETKINIVKENMTVIELDGKDLPDEFMFVDEMQKNFKLPDAHHYRYSYNSKEINWDAFEDRMTELSWFSDEINFILIIYNYKELMKWNLEEKKIVIKILQYTCEFWQEEVLHVVVNGKTRGFNVYLVD